MEENEKFDFFRIEPNIKPEEVLREKVVFPNSKIRRIVFKEKEGFFYRFLFESSFDYMGKAEILFTKINVFRGKPIKGDLSEYALLNSEKKKVNKRDYSDSYFCAREELKKILQTKKNQLSKVLGKDFDYEKGKIEKSFLSETKKFQIQLGEIAEKLMEYARKGEMEKIAEQKKLIDSLKKGSNFGELEKDKTRAIQLETQKHLLNVKNDLKKVSVVYYPIYSFDIEVENEDAKKSLDAEMDFLSGEISGLKCEVCSNKMREIVLCSSGHSVCRGCSGKCQSCEKVYCKKCLKNTCEMCSKKICKNCSVRCFRCSKLVCSAHTRKDKLSGHFYCFNCLKECENCGELKDPFSFKVSKKTNKDICEDCFREEMKEKVLKGVFEE